VGGRERRQGREWKWNLIWNVLFGRCPLGFGGRRFPRDFFGGGIVCGVRGRGCGRSRRRRVGWSVGFGRGGGGWRSLCGSRGT